MKEEPRYLMPKPCSKKWDEFEESNIEGVKFSTFCSENVHDLRNLDKVEIKDWFKKSADNNYVIIKENQLYNQPKKNNSYINLKKIGIASVIIGSSLLPFNSIAQENQKADSYKIEQTQYDESYIVIEGKVKVKALLGWKRLDDYSISVFSNDVLLSETIVDNRGKFKIKLNRKDFSDKMSISIDAFDYKSIQIENIDVKNTQIKVFLDKQVRIMTGRFF